MTVAFLPETAPFSQAQRAWLNGFLAGAFGMDGASVKPAVPAAPPPPEPEDFPWHDPALPMAERLKLAEGRPFERTLMAAMAQLDCGSCGYLCETYAEAIAKGEDTDLTKCSPGGKETFTKLKELIAARTALPVVERQRTTATATGRHTRRRTARRPRMARRTGTPRTATGRPPNRPTAEAIRFTLR